jgi:integrase
MQIQRTIRKIKNRAGKTVYHARVRWRVDSTEKWREMLRRADNASNAQKKLDTLAAKIEEKGPAQLQTGKVTFRELAQWSKEKYYVPAVYDDHGSKIAGVRGVKAAHHSVDNLVKFFGDTNIRKIDIEKLRAYKVARITGTCELSKVSLATVNRELSKARKLFNIALDKEWIFKTPFTKEASKELIQEAAETPSPLSIRELTDEEAERVMKVLNTPEGRHTLPVFIAVQDTGARRGSLLEHLRWKHVNFDEEVIVITSYKGKNVKRWPVPMTARLKKELLRLELQRRNKDPEALVFELAKVNLRKVWRAAYAEAGVPKGVRLFYSVRHAFGTNMANDGMELPELARLFGHSDPAMSYRYYNLTKHTIDKARNILNKRAVRR